MPDPNDTSRAGSAPAVGPAAVSSAVLSNRAITVLAVASALSVANGYYIQPLLVVIAEAFAVPEHLVGFLPAMTQVGLACGVAFLLPLGDAVSARTLLMAVIPLQVVALLLFSASEHGVVLAVACLLIGIFGITPYVLPPYASLHVPVERVGHVTGVLTRGILVGILLARTVAGVVGTHLGWRAVYWIAAADMVCVLIALRHFVRAVPKVQRETSESYGDLLLSLVHLVRTVPELRTAALCQAIGFGSFNVFWLGASLYLQSPQFGWTPQSVGLVALVGAIAALAAPLFGRAADRMGPRVTRLAALASMGLAWLMLAGFREHLAGMGIGLVLLEIGAAVLDISNRTILYGLNAEIRTRLNAIYTIAMLGGGAIMSVLTGFCWSVGGWTAVCLLGLLPTIGSIVLAVARMRHEPNHRFRIKR